MIITRAPVRLTFGGGGTDLASYYSKHEGFLISAAINKYIYITVNKRFDDKILAKYSKTELVDRAEDIKHPLIREGLKLTKINEGVEVTSMADVPSETGLGSSSSYTVALLKALHIYNKRHVLTHNLAEEACKIEIGILKEPIGKQDQYASAFGGITCFIFHKNGGVTASPLRVSDDTIEDLKDNLLLFYTQVRRRSHDILKEQDDASKKDENEMIENLHKVKKLGLESKKVLERGDTKRFGELMHIHWQNKKKRSGKMSNPEIDKWYNIAMRNGAIGGKLIGAGGGGFLMFYAKERDVLRNAMRKQGLRELLFSFDFEGCKVMVGDH